MSRTPPVSPLTGSPVSRDAYAAHARKVDQISRALRARTSTRPLSLRKRGPSHQVPKGGDLKYSTDFRQVYTSLLEDWLHADPLKVLDQRFDKLPLLS